ncbi:sigma-70 family RNA polymerase sigma factor [uncultured Clostridium sp.]|uniref:sigma-70 family RNA polymerase sigma factor n=1 Tax=uncultured Clostridium sp. TaxID=59620 RepID=UPI0025E8DDAE|nr:sigma-70 family RNA polymerase sigma factor [uncultured Clostridium sp.]
MTNENLVKLYQQGNKKALESLINNNIGIVTKIALKYNNLNKAMELDDLIQCGYIGLINAADKYKFDLDHPTSFITYAFVSIKYEILSCVNGKGSREKGNNELYNSCTSLYTQVNSDGESNFIDFIDSDDRSIENIEDKLYFEQLRKELEQAMRDNNTLVEREILKLYCGFDVNPIQLEEIAELLSMKYVKVKNLKSKALREIRNSVWGRTKGKKYKDEIIGERTFGYIAVENKIDEELEELRNLYSI